MNKLKQELYLLSLAQEADEGKIKQLYAENRLTAEQYIEVTEMINSKTAEELSERSKLVNDMILEIEAKKIAERQARSDKLNQLKTKGLNSVKSVSDTASNLDSNQTRKFGMMAGLIVGAIIVLVGVVSGGMYIYDNFFGYTKIDLADYAVAGYEDSYYTTEPNVFPVWDYAYYRYDINMENSEEVASELGNPDLPKDQALLLKKMSPHVKQVEDIITDVHYSTEQELSNGDQFEITISYDEQLAKDYKLKIVNNKKTFTVTGLPEPTTIDDITPDMLSQLTYTDDQLTQFIKERIDSDVSQVKVTDKGQFYIPEYEEVEDYEDYVYPAVLVQGYAVEVSYTDEDMEEYGIGFYGYLDKDDQGVSFDTDAEPQNTTDSITDYDYDYMYNEDLEDLLPSDAIELDSTGKPLPGQDLPSEVASEQ